VWKGNKYQRYLEFTELCLNRRAIKFKYLNVLLSNFNKTYTRACLASKAISCYQTCQLFQNALHYRNYLSPCKEFLNLMLGTEMVFTLSVTFSQLARLISLADFVNLGDVEILEDGRGECNVNARESRALLEGNLRVMNVTYVSGETHLHTDDCIDKQSIQGLQRPAHCIQRYFKYGLYYRGPPLWLQIQRSRVRFPALPDFQRSSGSGKGSTQPREYKWQCTWKKNSGFDLEIREYGSRDPSR
jgi:hypothetical protein